MKTEDLQKLREDYSKLSLDEHDVKENPFEQFRLWLNEAAAANLPEPNAMTLATVDQDGQPHTRVVLLKGFDEHGFVFYTNQASAKGQDIEGNAKVSICFLWIELERQVRIDGLATKLPQAECEAYFKLRPYKSQIGALASNQSEEVESRAFLEEKFNLLEAQYSEGEVPMPPSWGGYCIKPNAIEFWQGRRSRLHDRIVYEEHSGKWIIKRLAP